MSQREIFDTMLITHDRSVCSGWSRSPVFSYDSYNLSPRKRLVESDRYIVFNEKAAVFMELMDCAHLSSIELGTADLIARSHSSELVKLPFSFGSLKLPADADKGSIKIKNKNIILDFSVMQAGSRLLKLDHPGFNHGSSLRGVVVLSPPEPQSESLHTVMAWRRDASAFRYSRKDPWYSAEGVIQYGDQELVFSKGSSWAVLDWNRGIAPRRERRYWAAACGDCSGRRVSFTFGYGSAVSETGTENALFLDGKLHKLNQVTFRINPKDWMRDWHFTSDDNRVDLVFSPAIGHSMSCSSFFRGRKRRFFIGTYSGTLVLDDGEVISCKNMQGIAERSRLQL